MDQPYHAIPAEAIDEGVVTDAYFERTEETLAAAGRNPEVVAEVTADQFGDGTFEVLAGVPTVAQLFEGLPVDVDALPEGTLFDGGPVVQIQGPYRAFARYETALLGLLSHPTGFATRALAARTVAPETPLYSFGSRHVHPSLAAVVERAAMLAGFDGFSNVAAEPLVGGTASGTMPHALMLVFGQEDITSAWVAFDEAVDQSVPRIALCDTFTDERDESLKAARALGDALDGVRLDTTGSRRGDYSHIVREVRWELDTRGYDDVDIFLSGGIDLELLDRLEENADGFGVGSFITNADPVDFALDIVEVEGEARVKRGKLAGKKAVYRTPEGDHVVRRADEPAPSGADSLLEPVVRDGEIVADFDFEEARKWTLADRDRVAFDPWNHE